MKPRSLLSWANFFAFSPYYLINYVLAPYLATFMPESTAALAVSLGAAITLIIFPFIPSWAIRFGPQRLGIIFAGLEGVTLLLLATHPAPLFAVLLIALACAFAPFIVYQLDLMLEACVEDEGTTGRIRTAFITAGNCALLLSPLVIGILLGTTNHYSRVFFVAALSMIPFILLMLLRTLPHVHPPRLRKISEAFVMLFGNKDLRAAAFSNIILQFLFQLTPLYVSLYLHTSLGIPWSRLGWVLAVALIPLVVLEYPAGWIADTKFGDKTLLAAGYVIAGLSFAAISLIHQSTSIGFILLILILLRVGCSFIESMTESHFFRRVSSEDADMVGIYRMMRPIGALIAPIVGSLLLSVGSFGSLFSVAGFGILVLGVSTALAISSSSTYTGSVRNVIE